MIIMNEKRQVWIPVWEIWKFLLHSRFEIIIAWMERDRLIEWMVKQDKVVLKEACINYIGHGFDARETIASYPCSSLHDSIQSIDTHIFSLVPRVAHSSHELRLSQWDTCVAARFLTPNNWIPTSGRGAFVTLGETRPTLNESRSIGKLFDCQKDKPSSGEGESEKVRFQSDLDFFAGDL